MTSKTQTVFEFMHSASADDLSSLSSGYWSSSDDDSEGTRYEEAPLNRRRTPRRIGCENRDDDTCDGSFIGSTSSESTATSSSSSASSSLSSTTSTSSSASKRRLASTKKAVSNPAFDIEERITRRSRELSIDSESGSITSHPIAASPCGSGLVSPVRCRKAPSSLSADNVESVDCTPLHRQDVDAAAIVVGPLDVPASLPPAPPKKAKKAKKRKLLSQLSTSVLNKVGGGSDSDADDGNEVPLSPRQKTTRFADEFTATASDETTPRAADNVGASSSEPALIASRVVAASSSSAAAGAALAPPSTGHMVTSASSDSVHRNISSQSVRETTTPEGLLWRLMDRSRGVTVCNRKWHLRTYKECFVMEDAVEWVAKWRVCRREAAVVELEQLRVLKYIRHVVDKHKPVIDGYFFFVFTPLARQVATKAKRELLASRRSLRSLRDLASLMRDPLTGVRIKDRRWRLRTFKQCFVGSAAVDWMLKHLRVRTRAEAVTLCQRLLRDGIIRHVCDDHEFKDAFLFYTFERCSEGAGNRLRAATAGAAAPLPRHLAGSSESLDAIESKSTAALLSPRGSRVTRLVKRRKRWMSPKRRAAARRLASSGDSEDAEGEIADIDATESSTFGGDDDDDVYEDDDDEASEDSEAEQSRASSACASPKRGGDEQHYQPLGITDGNGGGEAVSSRVVAKRRQAFMADVHGEDGLGGGDGVDAIGIATFEWLKVLGVGGFGKVVLARKKDTGRLYAIKVIDRVKVASEQDLANLISERQVLANDHSFLLHLHWSFQTDSKLYLVLDYIAGGDLFFHLQRSTRGFSRRIVKFFAAQIFLAIEHLHSCGVIYRDLKLESMSAVEAEAHAREQLN
jgi:Protein kinase domain/Domain found in Dishevelled, Egl-10, and Pleckstrin (DEP)